MQSALVYVSENILTHEIRLTYVNVVVCVSLNVGQISGEVMYFTAFSLSLSDNTLASCFTGVPAIFAGVAPSPLASSFSLAQLSWLSASFEISSSELPEVH